MSFELFFMKEVPAMLKNLKVEASPIWGSFSAPEMLDHLRRGIELSLEENVNVEMITPAEQIPAFQQFLKGDRLFKKGSPIPKEYELIPIFKGDFETLKINLLKAVVKMQVHFEKHPDHSATHPNFGVLDVELWKYLHKKHILHHFTQFRIAPVKTEN